MTAAHSNTRVDRPKFTSGGDDDVGYGLSPVKMDESKGIDDKESFKANRNAVIQTILFGVSYGVGCTIARHFSAYLLNLNRKAQMDSDSDTVEEEGEVSNIITIRTQCLPYSFLRVPTKLTSTLSTVVGNLSPFRLLHKFLPLHISSSYGSYRFGYYGFCFMPIDYLAPVLREDKKNEHDKHKESIPQTTLSDQFQAEISSDSASELPFTTSYALPPKYISSSSRKNSNKIIMPTFVMKRQKDEEKCSRRNSVLTQTDESIENSTSKNSTGKETRYFEMLVHNVSHVDLVLSLSNPSLKESKTEKMEVPKVEHHSEESADILCRPHFSAFHMFATRILLLLRKCCDKRNIYSLSSAIVSYPRYERSDCLPRFPLVTPHPSRQKMLPVGFKLSHLLAKASCSVDEDEMCDNNLIESLSLDAEDIQSLRIRGRDTAKFESLLKSIEPTDDHSTGKTRLASAFHLEAILFPLLSSLLRQWHSQLLDKYGSISGKSLKKVIILVSGVGTPRNFSHSKCGNSTEGCAELMEMFIKVLYPDVAVIRLHSEREIFQYEENIFFSKKEFMPCIDAYRDAHARGERYPDEYVENGSDGVSKSSSPKYASTNPFDPDWKQTFSVTLSFADGAPARTHAIQTSLRPYTPCTMHFYEPKTFWYEAKICDDDVVHLSFEDMETVPAMEVANTSSNVQMVVKEMKIFRQHFLKAMNEGENDLHNFWLRKTKKPVLAVLLVNLPQKGLVVYRGMNMEVSMPTGSLCAERNVIGTALASNPGLLREHLKMVAVLALPLQSDETYISSPPLLPSPPRGVGPNLCRSTSAKDGLTSSKEADYLFSEVKLKLSQYQQSVNFSSHVIGCMDSEPSNNSLSSKILRSVSSPDLRIIPHSAASKNSHTLHIRKIKLHDYGDNDSNEAATFKANRFQRKKRTVLVQEHDMNPLKPCGACNEWLKKISESNPYFKVITFTDTYCNGVYVMPCQG